MLTREFTFEKATKNTYRYQEDVANHDAGEDNPAIVGAIYIQKHALPTKPVRIKVTIEEVPA